MCLSSGVYYYDEIPESKATWEGKFIRFTFPLHSPPSGKVGVGIQAEPGGRTEAEAEEKHRSLVCFSGRAQAAFLHQPGPCSGVAPLPVIWAFPHQPVIWAFPRQPLIKENP